MKKFSQYVNEREILSLNEGLLDKLVSWFKNVFKSQETLNNKTLKVDLKEIKSPENPMSLKDVIANKEEMNLINDNNVGFPVQSDIINNKKKYLEKKTSDNKTIEYQPVVERFFYVEGQNRYDIGVIMYDTQMNNDNNFINMLNLEVIQKVDNHSQVQKYINDIFEGNMKRKSFNGAQYTVTHPRVKAALTMLGYKEMNTDKNIIFKQFK